MKNKDFDKIFKDILSEHNQSNPSSDWDVFSQLLKNEQGFEEVDFDASVRDKIKSHKQKINPVHWETLNTRITKEENIRKKVFTAKTLELLALFLLFFGFLVYDNLKFQNTPFVFKFDVPSSQSTMAKVFQQSISNHVPINPQVLIAVSVLRSMMGIETLPVKKPMVVNQGQLERFKHDFSQEYLDVRSKNMNPSNSHTSVLENIPTSALSVVHLTDKPEIKQTEVLKPSNTLGRTFLSGTLSTGIGITKSSYDKVYNIKAYEAYDNQFSFGLSIGKKKGDFEYATGIKFTRRANEPARVIETYGDFLNNYYEISLNKITYNIVEVPVNLKYFFDNKGKTNYYVKAGVNANLSMHNTYTITNKPKDNSIKNKALASTISISDGDEIEGKASRSKLTQKEFSPGILNGGSLSDNYFMTASLELGVERQLSKDFTIFAGAEYTKFYMIDGIGPNKEKLNNLALNIGLKKYLH